MARIFLSHSSHDNDVAIEIYNILTARGWSKETIFLDLYNIDPMEDWKTELRRNLGLCTILIFICSEKSLQSFECRHELRTALDLGKDVLTIVIDDTPLDDPRLGAATDFQLARISPNRHGQPILSATDADTLVTALINADISPDHFRWLPRAAPELDCPFPGLRSFDEGEAGIFFGRDSEIASAMKALRLLALEEKASAFVIQAASGVGKSSFLRAGLWPRLRREENFLPLGVTRASKALDGAELCAMALGSILGATSEMLSRSQVIAAIKDDWRPIKDAFRRALKANGAKKRTPESSSMPMSLVIGIDQLDEIASPTELEKFRYALGRFRLIFDELCAEFHIKVQFIFAIRSANVDLIPGSIDGVFDLVLDPFFLMPMTQADYRQVIREPCKAANEVGFNISVDDSFCDAVLADCNGADALPMLAYSLRRVFEDNRHKETVVLSEAEYEASGGIGRIIQNALEQVGQEFGGDGFQARLKRLILPHFVEWSFGGLEQCRARVVPKELVYRDGDADSRMLCDLLIAKRLIIEDQHHLEIAHESLIRQAPVSDWLSEERQFLQWLANLNHRLMAFKAGNADLLTRKEIKLAESYAYTRSDEIDRGVIKFIFDSMEKIELNSFADLQEKLRGRNIRPSLRTRFVFLALSITLLAASQFSDFGTRVSYQMRNMLFDAWQNVRAPTPTSEQVAVVLIDRLSAVPLNMWPFLRSDLAEVVNAVRAAGARHIILDFQMFEHGPYSLIAMKRVFAEKHRDALEIPTFIDPEGRLSAAIGSDVTLVSNLISSKEAVLHDIVDSNYNAELRTICGGADAADGPKTENRCIVTPPQSIVGDADYGFSYYVRDKDRLVRRLPLFQGLTFTDGDMQLYPHIALAPMLFCDDDPNACAQITFNAAPEQTIAESEAVKLTLETKALGQWDVRLPPSMEIWVDYSKARHIDQVGDPARPAFVVTVGDLLRGRAPDDALRGKTVFVGGVGPQMSKMLSTSLDDDLPSAVISAMVLQDLIDGAVITNHRYDPLLHVALAAFCLAMVLTWFLAGNLTALIIGASVFTAAPVVVWMIVAETVNQVSSIGGLAPPFLIISLGAVTYSVIMQIRRTQRIRHDLRGSSFGQVGS